MAGIFREENIAIRGSQHDPPHFKDVPLRMREINNRILKFSDDLRRAEGVITEYDNDTEERFKIIEDVMNFASYLHRAIAFVHPFRDGNGRTARLAANLILQRYGLAGISIKVEKENKNRYCDALAQIDKHGDYDPLISLITEGLIDRYKGVPMKFNK